MKTVTFSIFKGGTGKTTSVVSTAAALAQRGQRVLLVDLDQQASATRYLDLDPEQSPNLYEVFMGVKPPALAIRTTRFGVDALTSHLLLAAIEEALEPGDELGVTSRKGQNRTLRASERSKRPEPAVFDLFALPPEVIAGQVDVFPPER